MKGFRHLNAATIDQAVSILGTYGAKAKIIAGGTDLLGTMKDEILPQYPEMLVNIKTVPGLDYIKEEAGMLKIGALTKLEDIATNTIVKSKYCALADAANKIASAILRKMGTIGGNLCQGTRCWYYRASDNSFNCRRKNSAEPCYALRGDHRYHSIFGADNGCVAVNSSDIAPALVALDAKIRTSSRVIDAESFFAMNGEKTTVLDDNEIVTEIQMPTPAAGTKSVFIKFALRRSIDFPIVNCAAVITNGGGTVSAVRICLNAVHNNPYRVTAVEDSVIGKSIDETTAEAAGSTAVADARPMAKNKYKAQLASILVKRVILVCSP